MPSSLRSKLTRLTLAAAVAASGAIATTAVTVATAGTAQAASSVGGQITRSEVLARANDWYNRNIQYDQDASATDVGGRYYRTDCSGFVSMAWHLGGSENTDSIDVRSLTTRVALTDLQPGDALDNDPHDGNILASGHIVLFDHWIDRSAGTFAYIAESSAANDMQKGTASIYSGNIGGHPAGGYFGLRYNNITGSSASAGTESGGAGRVRWADFDGDGRADYVVLNDNGSVRVFLNRGGDGHGGWNDLGQVSTGMTSDRARVRLADYDGDGRADYLLINANGSVRVFLNKGGDGRGGWSDLGQVATGLTADPSQVTFADFDGDGRTDYVVTQADGAVGVFRNTGVGSWSDLGKVAGGVTTDRSRIKWADIDGDGRADYNIVNPGGSITSYVNHGGDTGGGWTLRAQITTGLTGDQNAVSLADINADGRADYLVTTGPTTAFLNNGGDDRNNPGWLDYGQIAAGA
ncbi:VCBS repeat-containing protein [Kitasatospora purpeofusca]|uniref:FG-GAP repeat domain-containing protein n=1 Tax=Kitasatospora purpeofusca TaxID=67352 RepID=UPI003400BE5B